MSDFQLKENSGTLFKNDKGDHQNRPDYRGEINIHGRVYKLSAWIKEGKKGKFMSLSAQNGDGMGVQTTNPRKAEAPKPTPAATQNFEDDDIPF